MYTNVISRNTKASFIMVETLPVDQIGVVLDAFTGPSRMIQAISSIEVVIMNKKNFNQQIAQGLCKNIEGAVRLLAFRDSCCLFGTPHQSEMSCRIAAIKLFA